MTSPGPKFTEYVEASPTDCARYGIVASPTNNTRFGVYGLLSCTQFGLFGVLENCQLLAELLRATAVLLLLRWRPMMASATP